MTRPARKREREPERIDSHKGLILSLGGRPIAFQGVYATLPGCNVNCALLLSQMIYWSSITTDPDGWFYKTREEWAAETALSVDEIDASRKRLRACGVVRERLKGVPACLHFLVDIEKLECLLQSSFRKNRKRVSEEIASQFPTFPRTSFRKNRKLYKEAETTSETTTKTTAKRQGEHVRVGAAHARMETVPDPIPSEQFEFLENALVELGIGTGKRQLGALRQLYALTEDNGDPVDRAEEVKAALDSADNLGDDDPRVFVVAGKILRGELFS